MKKSLVWVVLLGVALGLSSCGSDDDSGPSDAIAGTWALTTYRYTEMPATYSKYEEFETNYVLGIELAYTIVFYNDGTYSRAYIVDERYIGAQSIYDKGKWTREGDNLKLTPNSTTDLSLIEKYGGTPGLEFEVVGDISELRMTLATPATVFVLPDSFPDEEEPTNEDFVAVDSKVELVFNKL